jgi:hypothetical protein
MKMRVLGIIKEKESGKPLSGLLVCAFDKDLLRSDFLGKAKTGSDGKFKIEYDSKEFKDLMDKNPDIYLEIYRGKDADGFSQKRIKPVFTTKKSIRYSASSSEKFYIELPKKKLG